MLHARNDPVTLLLTLLLGAYLRSGQTERARQTAAQLARVRGGNCMMESVLRAHSV